MASRRQRGNGRTCQCALRGSRAAQQYDNIVLTHVLEHIDDPVRGAAQDQREWLADAGRFFLVCPNANAPSRQIAVKMGLITHNAAVTPAELEHGHRCTYTLDTLERDATRRWAEGSVSAGIFFKALANFQWDQSAGDGHHFQGVPGWLLRAWPTIPGPVLKHLSAVRKRRLSHVAQISALPTATRESRCHNGSMKISFVVAVYRNAGAITKTYEKIKDVFARDLHDYDYEFVFVDDGSDDGSLEEILELQQHDDRVKAITFTRNFGQMAAMLAGLSRFPAMRSEHFRRPAGPCGIDPADGVQVATRGRRFVVCYRTDRSDTLAAKLFSKFAYGALRLSIPEIPPGGFDFVLMDRAVLDEFKTARRPQPVLPRRPAVDRLSHRIHSLRAAQAHDRHVAIQHPQEAQELPRRVPGRVLPAHRFISLAGFITAALGVLYSITIVCSWMLHSTPRSRAGLP